MDGFHLPRSVLDDLSNRKEAYARRGAAWTFDVKGILALVQLLRSSADVTAALRKPIYAPTFDHAIKDPVENGVLISGEVSIIILEGNYLLLDEVDWREISRLVDLRIFVEVDPVEARTRVARRHVYSGIEMNREDAEKRFDQNDGINGTLVRKRLVSPDIVVKSVPERAT
jgi:pantothenate kinase